MKLYKAIRWRLMACYSIAHWIIIYGNNPWHPFQNRGYVVKMAWNHYREQEFPRIKIDSGCKPIEVEVRPIRI